MMHLASGIREVARARSPDVVYESAGTGDPAVMFIHGIFGDRTHFASQLEYFASRRRTIVVDLRGHGQSGFADSVTIDDFAADVDAVASAAGVESVVLCGHSMAGVVGLRVAEGRPDLVRGVVMLDSVVLFPDAIRQMALTELVPALATDHWLEAVRGYFARVILDPRDPPELNARVMRAVDSARPEVARTFFGSIFASDYADDLTKAGCPLLYIHAKAPTELQRLADLRPDAMIGQVVGSGHYLMLTVPDQVNAMVDRFLEVVTAPATTSRSADRIDALLTPAAES